MRGTVVGVLRGGPSREHDVSLLTGAAMTKHLSSSDHLTIRDIYIDRNGVWHERGRPTTPTKALSTLDVVLIGLHGEYGEDGEVQKVLERHGVPYAGSDSLGSFMAMHKFLAKQRAKDAGLKVARDIFIEKAEDAEARVHEAVRSFLQPVVVKPVRWGSSVGISLLSGFAPVNAAVQKLFAEGVDGVLIEEYIRGTEATAGVVEHLRNEELYALPIVEIIPPASTGFFSREVKYNGETQEIVPGRFHRDISRELAEAAKTMHRELGLRHYSRSDFIVSPRGICYLEAKTLPGMTEEALLPKSLESVGVSFKDFLNHLIHLATKK